MPARPRRAGTATPLSVLAIVAMAVVGAVVVISRRPDAATNPQFWAEDGRYWFSDAYNIGVRSVLRSVEGYLQTLPRLVALPVTGLSLSHAALFFNMVGLAVQVAPAAFFVSARCEPLAPRRWVRCLVGLAYVLLPNFEVNVTVTNAQWHLAILALLVIVARPPLGVPARAFDLTVVILSGLTGPFAVVLLPLAAARAWGVGARRRWYAGVAATLLVTLAVQGVAVLLGHRDPRAPLGVSFGNLVTIVADRIVLPGTFGEEGHAHVYTAGSHGGVAIAALVSALALGVVIVALWRGGTSFRLFILGCAAITVLCLAAPIATPPNMTAWASLASSDGGQRYFLVPEVAWVGCVVRVLAMVQWRAVRGAVAVALAGAFASGLLASWSYPAYVDLHPAQYTAALRAARAGSTVVIPVNPGGDWAITVVRH